MLYTNPSPGHLDLRQGYLDLAPLTPNIYSVGLNVYYIARNTATMRTFAQTREYAVQVYSKYTCSTVYAVDVSIEKICTTRIVVRWPLWYAKCVSLMRPKNFYSYFKTCSISSLLYSLFANELVWMEQPLLQQYSQGHRYLMVHASSWQSRCFDSHLLKMEIRNWCNILRGNLFGFVSYYWIRPILTLDWQSLVRSKNIWKDVCVKQDDYPVLYGIGEPSNNNFVTFGKLESLLTLLHVREKTCHIQDYYTNRNPFTNFGKWYTTFKDLKHC